MLLNTILLAGAAQGLIMGTLLLLKKKKIPAEILLGIWMLIIVFHLTVSYMFRVEWINSRVISIFNNSVPFLQAPMIYLYFSLLFLGRVKVSRMLLHFIPAGLFIVYAFIGRLVPWLSNTFSWYIILSVPLYTIWILRSWLVITKKGSSFNQASNWLKWPLIGLCVIWITFLVLRFLPGLKELNLHPYFFIAVAAFVYLVAIHLYRSGLSREQDQRPSVSPQLVSLEAALKYSKSGLSEEKAEEIRNQLELVMNNSKPYLDPELNLRTLAGLLEVRINHLSQVINSIEGKGFHDYINSYRIKEFLYQYQSSHKKNFTLLAYALECGFSSKSSFNRIFRKELGTSPSEYLKNINKH